jgi:hypothetical protein
MTMRDKIAAIICDGKLQMITYEGIADAIIKALPDYEAQQARSLRRLTGKLVIGSRSLGRHCEVAKPSSSSI